HALNAPLGGAFLFSGTAVALSSMRRETAMKKAVTLFAVLALALFIFGCPSKTTETSTSETTVTSDTAAAGGATTGTSGGAATTGTSATGYTRSAGTD